MTNCYKCDTEIQIEDTQSVHALCPNCQTGFDAWFAEMLGDQK